MHLHQGTPESEFIRVVRHETGHTLGFPHEASFVCALPLPFCAQLPITYAHARARERVRRMQAHTHPPSQTQHQRARTRPLPFLPQHLRGDVIDRIYPPAAYDYFRTVRPILVKGLQGIMSQAMGASLCLHLSHSHKQSGVACVSWRCQLIGVCSRRTQLHSLHNTAVLTPSQTSGWTKERVDNNVLKPLDPNTYYEVGPQDRSDPTPQTPSPRQTLFPAAAHCINCEAGSLIPDRLWQNLPPLSFCPPRHQVAPGSGSDVHSIMW